MGILLMLRSQERVSAAALAAHYEVSTRTIYRDVDALAQLGIPVFAEMGRNGGFRLMPDYFMPPVAFGRGEALSLMLGLAFLKSLRVRPFAADADAAERKLLAALPERIRQQLMRAQEIIGIERVPVDLLHPERDDPQSRTTDAQATSPSNEAHIVSEFLSAVVDRRPLAIEYDSPYRTRERSFTFLPAGVLWDRDRWYLIGRKAARGERARTLRADRVKAIDSAIEARGEQFAFDVRTLLDRRWLEGAMKAWAKNAPVVIRMPAAAAQRLMQDWYFRYAVFERAPEGSVTMSYGEDDAAAAFALVRWLGPGAELLRPKSWRAALRAELQAMSEMYL